MNLLVIDTATEACSVALQTGTEQFSRFEICPQQHSQRLLPMIDEVLKEAKLDINDLDYLGFGRGPGSFTGVRIATGMLQGLALGSGLKVVGVSTLAAMAQQCINESENVVSVAVAIDARMEEVYFAQFGVKNGLATLLDDEAVLPPENAKQSMKSDVSDYAGTGWEAYETLGELAVNQVSVRYPHAKFMLPLALNMIEQGLALDVEDVQPVYLRDKVTWKKLPGR